MEGRGEMLVDQNKRQPTVEGRQAGTLRRLPTETHGYSDEAGKQENVDPGHRAVHRHSPGRELYPRRTKRSDRRTASRYTARPRHASLNVQLWREQDASRFGDGAQARSPSPASTASARLSKTQSLEREDRGGETNAPNGDPGAWPPSHRHSGAEDPLPVRSQAPRMEGRGEMLVDQNKRQPTTEVRDRLTELQVQSSAGTSRPRSPQHRCYRRPCCQTLELCTAFAG
ncbi:hypothetical protein E5288_WYG021748 [Bos mutus]|uniref:Uncharacterized protein n=1 Tax=Bos mutus TaxID=72004 RepID=A0A6B0SDT4_9CETA|nr:hypothetical protein [Bos mutus]